ncbi:F0F1 ATP synthase subunit I [Thioclava sp. SK-1]|uniref:AtpZ/AtpI family protein n=1 Tax=Thioclava sp. SK-1 TaxID=1889770 RepID=UPI000826DF09|nr:AtpZ/AtpI family protein [Thioclava sp. SK-1]OCX66798.1 F0F1 ATP synthase subunit I [Thioclava sp. SK-1]
MSDHPDPDRLEALEKRIKAAKVGKAEPSGQGGIAQTEMAWRMVVEMCSGLGIGFGIGYGLDALFGTLPIFMVVFTLLGLVAGVRVMMRSAAEMNEKRAAAEASRTKEGR